MSGVANNIDNLGAVHFDVEARRRKQQVSCDKSVGFNLDLRPNPLRRSPLRPGRWLFFLVTCVCLAISATYELVEWVTALLTGEAAEAFLGTQGDPWDTQWDMFLALVGALSAQVVLSRVHDRQLADYAVKP